MTAIKEHAPPVARRARGGRIYAALMGLAALAVLLQGLWAGLFLEHDGQRNAAGSWIDVHARGADVAIALTVIATIVIFIMDRRRRDLWIGGVVLALLLVLESYLGGIIRDDGQDSMTALHVPLALAVMALATWLSFRAARTPKVRA